MSQPTTGQKIAAVAGKVFQFLDDYGNATMMNDPIPNGSLPPPFTPLTATDNGGGLIMSLLGKGGKFLMKNGDDIAKAGDDAIKAAVTGKTDFVVSTNGVVEAISNGQHVLQKHVGLSDADLLSRLAKDTKIPMSSTFASDLIADNVVNTALRDQSNISQINNWLSNGAKGNLALPYKGTDVVGRGISQGSTIAQDLTNAKVILKSNGNGGLDILTAYPSN